MNDQTTVGRASTMEYLTTPSGLIFVKGSANVAQTLFTPVNGRTADGHYTMQRRHGRITVTLHKADGEPIAALIGGDSRGFAVSVGKHNGKLFYCYGISNPDANFLGLHESPSKRTEQVESMLGSML